MSTALFVILLIVLACTGVILRKTFFYVPTRELKRQAERGDDIAVRLYRAVAYEGSLQGLLWLIVGFSTAGVCVILVRSVPVWLSLVLIALLLALLFMWLPSGRLSRVGTKVTLIFTPSIAWLLNYLHPALGRAAIPVQKRRSHQHHTGVYEKEDLVRLVNKQAQQPDNRLSGDEIEAVQRALQFADQTVVEAMTPRKQVKTISGDETVGPILIDELHKLEQPFVLVAGQSKDDIVGILPSNRLGLKTSGKVRDHMDSVLYINAKSSLAGVFQAFRTTGQSLFIVVNDFEEFVGLVTVDAVIEQLVGALPEDDFDQYNSLSAVAAHDPSLKIDDEIVEEDDGELQEAAEADESEEATDEPEDEEVDEPEDSPEAEDEIEAQDEDAADNEQAAEADDQEVDDQPEAAESEDSEVEAEKTDEVSEEDSEKDEADSETAENEPEPEIEEPEDEAVDDEELEDPKTKSKKANSKPIHIPRKEKLDNDPDFDSIEVSD